MPLERVRHRRQWTPARGPIVFTHLVRRSCGMRSAVVPGLGPGTHCPIRRGRRGDPRTGRCPVRSTRFSKRVRSLSVLLRCARSTTRVTRYLLTKREPAPCRRSRAQRAVSLVTPSYRTSSLGSGPRARLAAGEDANVVEHRHELPPMGPGNKPRDDTLCETRTRLSWTDVLKPWSRGAMSG